MKPKPSENPKEEKTSFKNYVPLIVLILGAFIGAYAFSLRFHEFSWKAFLMLFMGLFFLELSLLKFFDITGFVQGFSLYDVPTQHFPLYGYIYPFIELGLGFLYLAAWIPILTNILTMLIMGIGAFGVIGALAKDKHISCACMGTVIKVPLTTVSLIENLGMGLMAFFMLF